MSSSYRHISVGSKGRINYGVSRTVHVVYISAPAANFGCFSTCIVQAYHPAVVVTIAVGYVTVVPSTFQSQVIHEFPASCDFINILVIFGIYFIVVNCCIYNAHFSCYTSYIYTVIRS